MYVCYLIIFKKGDRKWNKVMVHLEFIYFVYRIIITGHWMAIVSSDDVNKHINNLLNNNVGLF
jgi:hypothetical protein